MRELVKKYQCPGCMSGDYETCFKKGHTLECDDHYPATYLGGVGKILLGMPKGFNRIGNGTLKVYIQQYFVADKWNIPTWKYFDGENTIVRVTSPRINSNYIVVLVGNKLDEVDCYEVTEEDMEFMD